MDNHGDMGAGNRDRYWDGSQSCRLVHTLNGSFMKQVSKAAHTKKQPDNYADQKNSNSN
jgi:hypothetical protein